MPQVRSDQARSSAQMTVYFERPDLPPQISGNNGECHQVLTILSVQNGLQPLSESEQGDQGDSWDVHVRRISMEGLRADMSSRVRIKARGLKRAQS